MSPICTNSRFPKSKTYFILSSILDMTSEDFQNFEYIAGASARMREYIDANCPPGFVDYFVDYYNENSEFPENTFPKLLEIFKNLVDYRLDLVGIANNAEIPEGAETLYSGIFFPTSEEEASEANETEEEAHGEMVVDYDEKVQIVKSMDPNHLEAHQRKLSNDLANLLCIHEDIAFALLRAGKWKYDAVVLECMDDGCQSALKKLSLTPAVAHDPLTFVPGDVGLCGVCFDDKPLLRLPCGHSFCRDCWKSDIEFHIGMGKDNITCQEQGCCCPLSENAILIACGEETAQAYKKFLLESQIAQDQQLRHCIAPNCPNVLTIDSVGLCGTATCSCGARMCWNCRGDPHAPLQCENVVKWKNLTKEETLQAKWVVENTKPCPRCLVRIEKNGGCNHMACDKCGYNFCWICGHEWSTHVGSGYQCNKFVDFDDRDKSDIPQCSLVRLNHYHTRYMEQLKSIEAVKDKRGFFKDRLTNTFYQIGKVPMDEATKVADAVFSALDAARNVSVWSYPHAFFMPPDSAELRLFEHVQTNMESLIEQLSDMVENQFTALIFEFKQYAALLKKNTEVLLKHVDEYG